VYNIPSLFSIINKYISDEFNVAGRTNEPLDTCGYPLYKVCPSIVEIVNTEPTND
jgi:hypothetical protein